MHTPSHLARPVTGHHPDGSYYLPPGTSIDNLADPAPVPAMDRKDQIFVDLIRLRRYAVRLKWWQFTERKRISSEISDLLIEQDALLYRDNLTRNAEASL